MGRCNAGCWTVVLLAGLGFTTACAEEGEPSTQQIAQWIEELGDQSFAARDSASRELVKSGEAAIEAVAAAAVGDSLEVTVRVIRILEELSSPADSPAAGSAKQALAKLAASKHPAVALRARMALRASQLRIVAALERSGARVSSSGDRIVSVNFDAAKTLGPNLRLLHELPDLEHLSFSTTLMNDAGLAELQGLPRLRALNLYRSRVGDSGLKHLATLPSLRRVPMGETQVTDEGLVHLKDLTQLEYIGLRGNRVSDAGLVHLQKLTNLEGLYLGETQVTDAGLVHLRDLTKLTMLRLDQTEVSDVGLEHLQGLVELQNLYLADTQVTAAGTDRLKQALPKVQISMMKRP